MVDPVDPVPRTVVIKDFFFLTGKSQQYLQLSAINHKAKNDESTEDKSISLGLRVSLLHPNGIENHKLISQAWAVRTSLRKQIWLSLSWAKSAWGFAGLITKCDWSKEMLNTMLHPPL